MIKRKIKQIHDRLGWKTTQKYIVIESDDWGSERVPSRDSINNLQSQYDFMGKDPYCRYDTLANDEDLEELYNVLVNFRDVNYNYPVITSNTVMANPDYDKILGNNFSKYYYMEVKFKKLFYEGISNNFMFPQFHAREHLNVKQWMDSLRCMDMEALAGFKSGIYGMPTSKRILGRRNDYMATYDLIEKDDYQLIEESISEGLDLFYKAFNFRSMTTIAPCYTWDDNIELIFKTYGVKVFQGNRTQKVPRLNNGSYKYKRNFLGGMNKYDQLYLVRNCSFEPALYAKNDMVDDCLARIEYLFKIGKPVIISSHRLNYIGSHDKSNRDRTLQQLKSLLKSILRNWPDVEFINSEKLGKIILEDKIEN